LWDRDLSNVKRSRLLLTIDKSRRMLERVLSIDDRKRRLSALGSSKTFDHCLEDLARAESLKPKARAPSPEPRGYTWKP
jgi:hypothetical protein